MTVILWRKKTKIMGGEVILTFQRPKLFRDLKPSGIAISNVLSGLMGLKNRAGRQTHTLLRYLESTKQSSGMLLMPIRSIHKFSLVS